MNFDVEYIEGDLTYNKLGMWNSPRFGYNSTQMQSGEEPSGTSNLKEINQPSTFFDNALRAFPVRYDTYNTSSLESRLARIKTSRETMIALSEEFTSLIFLAKFISFIFKILCAAYEVFEYTELHLQFLSY